MKRANDGVKLEFETTGSVVDAAKDAKPASASITLRIKPLVADKMNFGGELYVLISDTEIPE